MKINSRDFRVRPGTKVKLKQWPTRIPPLCKSKHQYQKHLEAHVAELSSLQQLHYATNRHALLLIFQGMDAGGKDGAIRHVMSGVNPQGCEVFSFKQLLNGATAKVESGRNPPATDSYSKSSKKSASSSASKPHWVRVKLS